MSDEATKTHRLRAEDLTWREAQGVTIVLDQRRWVYLKLNGSGAVLWAALADGATTSELVEVLRREYGIDEATSRADVDAFLGMLGEQDLLTP